MKLYLNEFSPFSRAAAVVAYLSEGIGFECIWVDPWSSPEELERANPFCIIPVLELEDGTVLTESQSICQFLIANYPCKLIESLNLSDAQDCALMGFAKTLMDIAFRTVALGRFCEGETELHKRSQRGLSKALHKLEQDIGEHRSLYLRTSLAVLYLHIALDYIQLRHRDTLMQHAGDNVQDFLTHSPFAKVLETLSLDALSQKPQFGGLS